MILVKLFFRLFQIYIAVGFFVPRQIQHRIQIVAYNGRVLGIGGHLHQLVGVLKELFLNLLREAYFHNLFTVGHRLLHGLLVAQLVSDCTELFTEVIFPLIFVDAVGNIVAYFAFKH